MYEPQRNLTSVYSCTWCVLRSFLKLSFFHLVSHTANNLYISHVRNILKILILKINPSCDNNFMIFSHLNRPSVCIRAKKNEGSYHGNHGSKHHFDGWWCHTIWISIAKVSWESILLVCATTLLWNFVILRRFDVQMYIHISHGLFSLIFKIRDYKL